MRSTLSAEGTHGTPHGKPGQAGRVGRARKWGSPARFLVREMAQMCALCALGFLAEEFFRLLPGEVMPISRASIMIRHTLRLLIPDVSFHREGAAPRRNGAAKGALHACIATLAPGRAP